MVTDAGTPAISDPGMDLAAAWAAEGGRVVAIPGASAVLVAVAVSGIAGPRWTFEGFLPRSGRERRERLARLAADERGAVIFEAPSRLVTTLRDLDAACGTERPGAICRELTKLHEQVVRGSLGALVRAAADGTVPARGEIAIVLGWSSSAGSESAVADDVVRAAEARARVEVLVAAGRARGDAAREVAATTGVPRRQLYQAPDRDPGR